jgi:two-component system LytT family response regulator
MDFLRVHQRHLINVKYIKEFIKLNGGYLILKDRPNVSVYFKKNEILVVLNSIVCI